MKALKFILAFARVLLALLFAALACFSGKPAGIAVFALAAVLTLPINLFQKVWGLFGVKKSWIKILMVVALVGTGFSQLPAVLPNEPAPADVQPTATASIATPVPTTELTATPTVEPTAAPTATPEATAAPTKAAAVPAALTADPKSTGSPATSTAVPTEDSEATSEPTAKPAAGAAASATSEPDAEEHDYILNTKSKKFHWPDCSGIKNMAEKNRKEFTGTREEVVDMGFSSCGICKP